ncbi:hypothetical protein ACLK17_02735 [Escherichia coli]
MDHATPHHHHCWRPCARLYLGMLANNVRVSLLVGYRQRVCWQDHSLRALLPRPSLCRELAELGVYFADVRRRFALFAEAIDGGKATAIPRDCPDSRGDAAGYGALAVLGWSLMTGIVFG